MKMFCRQFNMFHPIGINYDKYPLASRCFQLIFKLEGDMSLTPLLVPYIFHIKLVYKGAKRNMAKSTGSRLLPKHARDVGSRVLQRTSYFTKNASSLVHRPGQGFPNKCEGPRMRGYSIRATSLDYLVLAHIKVLGHRTRQAIAAAPNISISSAAPFLRFENTQYWIPWRTTRP